MDGEELYTFDRGWLRAVVQTAYLRGLSTEAAFQPLVVEEEIDTLTEAVIAVFQASKGKRRME